MTAERRPADASALGLMVLLCALWGLQQVAIKVAAPDVAPIMQVALRSGVSAALVAAWARLRGQRLDLLGPTLRAERLSRLSWVGVCVAFGGIAVAFGGGLGSGGLSGRALAGDLLGVLAGAAWGATTVVVRRSALSEAPPAATLLYQLVVGFVLLLVAAAASGQLGHVALTPLAATSLLFQGVVISFASYLAWFWLLRRYLASRMSVLSFMTPLFGVTFGVLLLGEPLTSAFGAGAVLVLLGITIVSGAGLAPRRSSAEPAARRTGAGEQVGVDPRR